MMKTRMVLRRSLLLWSALMMLWGCQAGYGLKVGYQSKRVLHSGYSAEQIFDAARASLEQLGRVTSADRAAGVVEGEIPPYAVKATVKEGSHWLKLEGREEEHGAWKRDQARGEWSLSVDGRLVYRVGAATLKDALKDWSHAINLRIP